MVIVIYKIMLVVLPCFVAVTVHAQPDGVKLGSGLRLFHSLDFKYVRNDNFYFTRDKAEAVAGMIVKPELKLEKSTRSLVASASAGGEYGDFDSGSIDDYTDAKLEGQFRHRPNVRHRFSGSSRIAQGHDAFGQRRTEGLSTADRELDEYDTLLSTLGYRFGAPNSLLNVAYEISYFEQEYDTNRELGTRFLDYEYLKHEGALFWNYSPKTSAVLKVTQRSIEYPLSLMGFPDRSADEEAASVGLEWLPTAKTSGEVFVGRIKRKPVESGFDDFRGTIWSISAQWAPRSTTVWRLQTGRQSNESFLVNSSFIDTQGAAISWIQQWSPVVGSMLGVSYSKREFESISRNDDFVNGFFELGLRVAQEVYVDFKISYSDRDSSLDARDYDQRFFSVGFRYAP